MPLITATKKAIVVGIVMDGERFSDASAIGIKPIAITKSQENPNVAALNAPVSE